jgi:formylglycine-generating enzyme required for sulfatase activity
MKKEMKNPVADEKKDKDGNSLRYHRGGGWTNRHPIYAHVSRRYEFSQSDYGDDSIGFRIVRNKR